MVTAEPPYFYSTMCPIMHSGQGYEDLDTANRNPDNLDDQTTMNEGY